MMDGLMSWMNLYAYDGAFSVKLLRPIFWKEGIPRDRSFFVPCCLDAVLLTNHMSVGYISMPPDSSACLPRARFPDNKEKSSIHP